MHHKKDYKVKFPSLMGILNITQNSFYDGGKFIDINIALKQAKKLIDSGANIIDIGAESSKPFSEEVDEQIEIDRLTTFLKNFTKPDNIKISIDTSRSNVLKKCLNYNIDIVNDIYALRRDNEIASIIGDYGYKVVLMHMLGTPLTMQENPTYNNVIDDIKKFFEDRINYALKSGILEKNIILDPGIGFGKKLNDNLTILKNIEEFKKMGFPILIGPSRKSFIGEITQKKDVNERLFGTIGVSVYLASNGIDILRLHDIEETMDVFKMISAIYSA